MTSPPAPIPLLRALSESELGLPTLIFVVMSSSQTLLASARSAYRSALRASASTFSGDPVIRNGVYACSVRACQPTHHVVSAFRLKIRNEVLPYSSSIDPKDFEEKVTLVQDIANVLRKNVVQARKVEQSPSPEQKDVWGACI